MKITWKKQGATLTARFAGEMDHHTAAEVRRQLDLLLADATVKRMVFDFEKVSFMDSSGLGVILGRYRTLAARGGGIAIINASRSIDRILRMAGVYTLCDNPKGETVI